MKSFDEWFEEKYLSLSIHANAGFEKDLEVKNIAKSAFTAGQQSKQDEVDELQLKLSEDSKVLHNVIDIERRKCEELQKRIDEAFKSSKEFYDFGDGESAMAFCNEIMNILKGDSHES